MYKAGNKFDYYKYLKGIFSINGIEASPYEEINYGLQFSILVNESKCLIRVYESKKNGITCDLSQIKSEEILRHVESLIQTGRVNGPLKEVNKYDRVEEPEVELIGTDESGKGDYFGPLVIAGVYADAETKKRLKEMGAADSKTLSDSKIQRLAEEIAKLCKYSVVTVGNKRYNEMYDEIKNLNKLLAWGHARVIENLLDQVDCGNALSDQFGNPELIRNALMEKGKKINLEQRPRAEENVVVAAASIMARNEYVKAIGKLSEEYNMEFPKGGSAKVVEAAREFVHNHGREKLSNVAKLHFVITGKI